jgi:hypothetical protein
MTEDGMDLLLGGAPAAKFPEVGTVVKGKVLGQKKRQARDIDGELKVWEDGSAVEEVVFTLQTDDRDPALEDDDGARRIFAGGQMLKAIGAAIRKAGWSKPLVGGQLAVKYKEDGVPPRKGYHAPKIYVALYEPPSVADEFDAIAEEPAYDAMEEPF